MQCFHDLQAGPVEKLNGASIVLIPNIEVDESLKDSTMQIFPMVAARK
jgi:hypothetical protein